MWSQPTSSAAPRSVPTRSNASRIFMISSAFFTDASSTARRNGASATEQVGRRGLTGRWFRSQRGEIRWPPWGDPAAASGEIQWPPTGRIPWPPSSASRRALACPKPLVAGRTAPLSSEIIERGDGGVSQVQRLQDLSSSPQRCFLSLSHLLRQQTTAHSRQIEPAMRQLSPSRSATICTLSIGLGGFTRTVILLGSGVGVDNPHRPCSGGHHRPQRQPATDR